MLPSLQGYISPGRALKRLELISCENVELLLPIVSSASSLKSLALCSISFMIKISINLRLFLKWLIIQLYDTQILKQLVAALHSNTSLPVLKVRLFKPVDIVPILIKLLQSNHTLQELGVSYLQLDEEDVKAMVQLVEVAANSTSLKKLSCNKLIFDQLQSRIPKKYKNILCEEKYEDNWYN